MIPSARLLLATLLSLTCATGALAQEAVYRNEPTGTFLKTWLLCGPFPVGGAAETAGEVLHLTGFDQDFLTGLGGEAQARPTPGAIVTLGAESRTWTLHAGSRQIIDLDEAVSTQNAVVAYAYCEIEQDADTPAILSIGSNDGMRAWLNGVPVLDAASARGIQRDSDQSVVLLRAGANRLLIKIEERGNLWAFCCRLRPLGREVIESGVPLFAVKEQQGSAPILQLEEPQDMLLSLVKEATLEVQPRGGGAPVLTVPWNGSASMPLDLDPDTFQKLQAHLSVTLKGLDSPVRQVLPFTVGKRQERVLFEGKQSAYVIALAPDASESERWAAQELQHWIGEAGGPELPLVNALEPLPETAIVLGWNPVTAKAVGEDKAPSGLLDERFVYESHGATLYIYGGAQRGALYGVFSFLERELGCRWYSPTVANIPLKSRFAFDDLHHTEAPGVRVRNDFYYEAFEPIWAARNRVNGAMGHREQPGGVEAYWGVHTFYPLMPPAEFFGTHPEYYSLIDGERIHDHAQLCLTNPDVLRILTERILKTMRENPQYLIYCVSQNDWRNPCQCDPCQAIAKQEDSEAGPVLWFVNQVAEAAEKEFPGKFIGTLAYQYTRKPPKTLRPRENVVIRLCSIECCFSHDFKTCPENASFVADLEGWADIAPHMYIWDYVVMFGGYPMPFPNFRVLQSNIQTLQANKSIGIMEQAAYQSRGGEFAELRAYLIAKLLWDPTCDVEAVVNDFMYGYYGRAGQHVRAYYDLLQNRVTPDTHLYIFGLTGKDALFGEEFIRQADALFDRAEAVAEDEARLHRVQLTRLSIMYLKCLHDPVAAKADGTYARLREIVARENVTLFAEAGAPHMEAFYSRVEAAE
ncbi:MAG: DUF4838 domain-containing protein [Candidatus Hydrogenedentes bacterium]|nr:DUF4838 domain-containing protein [Candidatus Hydrogenedentota bacterium]